MKLLRHFPLLSRDRRPQDPNFDGTGLRFETMDHGGEYPDAMSQAIRLIDTDGGSCIYVPITQCDRLVDGAAFALDDEDA